MSSVALTDPILFLDDAKKALKHWHIDKVDGIYWNTILGIGRFDFLSIHKT